ncbi:DUF4231 domain-containing protein [Kitasatospora sp. NPDC089797]|uniref:DUF4231 domain-containing protein n=1 Tax=Kitasatospora sp. NPDC089797 TaxID=3155298 RepID=UPI003413570C
MDDDASHRLSDAEKTLQAAERARIAEERRKEQERLVSARRDLRRAERALARRRRLSRVRTWAGTVAGAVLLAGLAWNLLDLDAVLRRIPVDIILVIVVAVPGTAAVIAAIRLRPLESTSALEDTLDEAREKLRQVGAFTNPSLGWRRQLYREEVADIAGQYRTDSRRYRRVHNTLQSVVMAGSTVTTTVGALDSGYPARWHSFLVTGISFTITLAAMFAGYYKYRERSYFLQQTADAVEEEAYALTLGVGAYAGFEPHQEGEALALFTQRVEDLRNEQRRRQQQLDQPAEQTSPAGAPQT